MGRHTRRGILGAAAGLAAMSGARAQGQEAAVIVRNARITTLDPSAPDAAALAVAAGRFVKVGSEAEVMPLRGAGTTVIDAGGRRVIPGLIDSHLHIIRGGLNYNMELRWDGVPSLADGHAHAEGAGAAHAGTAMGACGRRLHRAPVRGEAAADPGRAQRGRARHAGFCPAPLRPRAAESSRAARGRLHARHARARGRHDRARRQRRAHRPAAGPAQRDDPLRHARQGPEAAGRVAGQQHPPFHARAQPAGRDQRHRRRRRLPELSRGLPGHRAAGRPGSAHRPHRLQPVHPEAQGGAVGLPALDGHGAPGAGQRHVPPQRRRRDAGVLGRRLRGLPRAAPGPGPLDGGRARAGDPPPGREPLAVPPARDLRRDHRRARSTCSSACTATSR